MILATLSANSIMAYQETKLLVQPIKVRSARSQHILFRPNIDGTKIGRGIKFQGWQGSIDDGPHNLRMIVVGIKLHKQEG